ncbi:MAG: hypothetical protein ABIH34_00335 [Nanoarchaeota archaeon]
MLKMALIQKTDVENESDVQQKARLLNALTDLLTCKTSYGDIIELIRGLPVSKSVFYESQNHISEVFGAPVSPFCQGIKEEDKKRIEQGLWYYPESAYYMTESDYGLNMMEVRPWGGWDRPSTAKCSVYIVHIPQNVVQGVKRDHHYTESLDECNRLMLAASMAEIDETEPKRLVDIYTNPYCQSIIDYFSRDWNLIALSDEETPQRYQQLLDRIDPCFRVRSQPLYKKRKAHGICLNVHRQHHDGNISIAVWYIPDAFRFTSDTISGATGLAGLVEQTTGVKVPSDIIG